MPEFTHFDEDGATRMVDVGSKEATQRVATATATVRMQPETLGKITTESFAKGDVLEVARLAGIMATKQTGQLIPLCHPIGIDRVNVDFEILVPDRILVRATVGVFAKTGVEMEAMTAVSVATLTAVIASISTPVLANTPTVALTKIRSGTSISKSTFTRSIPIG